jgi:hypothetical protein
MDMQWKGRHIQSEETATVRRQGYMKWRHRHSKEEGIYRVQRQMSLEGVHTHTLYIQRKRQTDRQTDSEKKGFVWNTYIHIYLDYLSDLVF